MAEGSNRSAPPGGCEAERIAALQAEIARLKGSELLHRTIVESATDFAILTLDADGVVTSWNPGAENLLGWSSAEMVGRNGADIFTPEDRERGAPQAEMLMAGDLGRAEDRRWHVRKDGSRFWANGLMMPLRDGSSGFLKILRDETARHEINERLRASEVFTRALFESSADCVKTLDLEGRLTAMNGPGLCLMQIEDFGRLVGQPWAELWPEDLRPEVRRAIAEARAGRVGRFYGFCPTAKGTPKWWDVQVSAVPDADGNPHFLLSVSRDMTERATDQLALGESEARFRNMADHAPVMMWVTDPSGYCTYLNRGWYEFTGQTQAEAEGFGWLDATHPEDRALAEQAFVSANAAQAPFRIEYRLRGADGTYHWAIDAASPRFGENREFLGYVGSVIDIQERREAEEQVRRSNARFRAAIDAVQGVLWTNNAVGQMEGEQPAWAALTGQSLEDYQGYGWAKAVHPEDAEPTVTAWNAAVQERRTFVFEHRVRCADGAYRTFSIRAVPLLSDDGAVQEWVGVHTDITERRQAEARLRDLNQTLEARVEQAIAERDRTWNNSRDLLLVVGTDGVFRAVNPAWNAILGWRSEDLVGRSYLDFIHPDDHPASEGALATASAQDLPVYENRYRHLDGSYRWISWVAAPEGDLIYASGRDVTADKEKQAELDTAQDQLRQAQKMEAVGQLTGGIAHDFNNLLTGVIGSLDMLQRRIGQGQLDKVERYATSAMSSANRAAALTHRLLAFSRRQPLDPQPVNANRLVTGMEELLRRSLGETVRLDIVTAGGLWLTKCDPHQLENAILNLAINGRDAMPTGGTITIETCNAHLDNAYAARSREVRPGQYVCICVTDTGAGMPADVVAKAFEPFFTTKPIGQGTGLGLSMIYGFARQSEGYVKIYSELEKGTTVKLYLPRYYGEGEEADLEVGGLREEHRSEHGEVVLVVEDETAVRDLIVDVLEELGYRAVEAADGPAGLKLVQSDMRIDLLVTDVGLPGLNGRQLADAARELRPELKVLFMTGYAENATIANGFLEPGMQMITKPFAIEAIATRIRDMIEAKPR